jgi:uncharacterized protein (TIGR02271 family)
MDKSYTTTPGSFAPLSKLADYEVADDSVDVRGWKVTGSGGDDLGKVDDLLVDPSSMQARYLVVTVDKRRARRSADVKDPVLVPVNRAHIDERGKRVELDSAGQSLADLPRYEGDGAPSRDYDERFTRAETPDRIDSGTQRVTRSAEELRVNKRKVKAGEVTVEKHVETERVKQPVTWIREEVTVERRPVTGAGDRNAEIRDDEVRIPITEEEVVIEKRPVVKEEIVIGKRQVQASDTVDVDLKRERVDVKRDGRIEPDHEDGKPRREV